MTTADITQSLRDRLKETTEKLREYDQLVEEQRRLEAAIEALEPTAPKRGRPKGS